MTAETKHDGAIPADIAALFGGIPTVAELERAAASNPPDLDADPAFVAAFLKAQFVEDILRAMEEQGLNKNTLARKLGKSRQYVGRLLNERSNFTVETLAEIACALNLRAAVRLHRGDQRFAVCRATSIPALLSFPKDGYEDRLRSDVIASMARDKPDARYLAS